MVCATWKKIRKYVNKEERYYSDDTFSNYLKCNSSLLLDATQRH